MGINVNEEGRPWSNSEGGPVLVIAAELAATWRGTLPPVGAVVPEGWTWGKAGGPECDYDRACAAKPFIPTGFGGFRSVPVGDGQALCLDSEIATEWFADGDGGCLVRKGYDESTPDPAAVTTWQPFPGVPTLTLGDGRLFLFDSAYEGDADPARIRATAGVGVIQLAPGAYTVECGEDEGETDYVRFVRA